MLCERCKNCEATVHLTQVVDGNVQKMHMCEECANKSGMEIEGPMSISDLLLGLGAQGAENAVSTPASSKSCASCGMTLSQFRKRGRLGCDECYECFMDELLALIKSMHHSTAHKGKVPGRDRAMLELDGEIVRLKEDLDVAVDAEEFERAAVLRDKIAELRARAPTKQG